MTSVFIPHQMCWMHLLNIFCKFVSPRIGWNDFLYPTNKYFHRKPDSQSRIKQHQANSLSVFPKLRREEEWDQGEVKVTVFLNQAVGICVGYKCRRENEAQCESSGSIPLENTNGAWSRVCKSPGRDKCQLPKTSRFGSHLGRTWRVLHIKHPGV